MRNYSFKEQLSVLEIDYLMLTVFVLAQNGHLERAGTLIKSLRAVGANSRQCLLADMIILFKKNAFDQALDVLVDLDNMDPEKEAIRDGRKHQLQMRRYVKARCLLETGRPEEAHTIIKSLTGS
jgi:outer membrane PBP1 activator LpoA protein